MRGLYVGDDGVFELADLSFHRVATVEEDDIVAALLDQFIDLFRLQMCAAANDTFGIDFKLARSTESDDFVANLDGEFRKVISAAFAPLELHGVKSGVLLGFLDVLLTGIEITSDGAVDAVLGHQNATFKP